MSRINWREVIRRIKVPTKERLLSFDRKHPLRYLRETLIILFRIGQHYYVDGWLAGTEAANLYRLASLLPIGSVIVEIGSWKGKSTYCLARGLRKGSRVVAIDPFDASGEEGSAEIYRATKGEAPLYEQFQRRMRALKVANKIQLMRGFSPQFVGRFPRIDLLFIDGDHSVASCDFDYTNYAPYIRVGGYLAIHDYTPQEKDFGPTWLVEKKVLPSGGYKFIGLYHSLWVGQKVK